MSSIQQFHIQFNSNNQVHKFTISKNKQSEKISNSKEIEINGRTYFIMSETNTDTFSLFTECLKEQQDLSENSIKQSLKEVHKITQNPIRALKLNITTELTEKILLAIHSNDSFEFMNILFKMGPKESNLIKTQITEYIEKNRHEFSQLITERKLSDNDSVESAFKPLSEDNDSFYSFSVAYSLDEDNDLFEDSEIDNPDETQPLSDVKIDRYFAEQVTVYELKDQQGERCGYVVVAKNKTKIDNLEAYKKIIDQRKSDSYHVEWISTDENHRNKGFGYLLLYNVLAQKLKDKTAIVSLHDSSGFAGTRIYANVHLYKDADGLKKAEFGMNNNLRDYHYYSLES